MLVMLSSMAAWSADGDTFTTSIGDGVQATFVVISESQKTCQLGTGQSNTSAFNEKAPKGTVYLPTNPNGYSLIKINDWAFYRCYDLVQIYLPNSVTSIGDYAFNNCSGLVSIDIPNSVEYIGTGAFSYCNSLSSTYLPSNITVINAYTFKECVGLTSVVIPSKIVSITINAFDGCNNIESISVDPENSIYDSRNNCNALIESNTNKLLKGCKDSFIPPTITSIESRAFQNCEGLSSITIPSSVTSIGNVAFAGCSNLTTISIPNSITSIGGSTFANCTSLQSIIIPSSVNSIGIWAFDGCNNLTSVTVERNTPITISSGTFSNCANPTLFVPAGSKSAYAVADYWRDFKAIKEITEDITISTAGIGTFCSTHALDFSGTDDIKAYIVSAFKPSTGEVTLTRITDVPANTGIVVKGDADTYSIPWGPDETIVSNMLVGVTENTVLNKVNGDYTNYILAKKNGNLGFYAVADGTTLSAGKAYLPLPTASLPSGARDVKFVFDDEQTTDITEVEHTNTDARTEVYDLQGRKVRKPAKGLYIVNGKKVTIK